MFDPLSVVVILWWHDEVDALILEKKLFILCKCLVTVGRASLPTTAAYSATYPIKSIILEMHTTSFAENWGDYREWD